MTCNSIGQHNRRSIVLDSKRDLNWYLSQFCSHIAPSAATDFIAWRCIPVHQIPGKAQDATGFANNCWQSWILNPCGLVQLYHHLQRRLYVDLFLAEAASPRIRHFAKALEASLRAAYCHRISAHTVQHSQWDISSVFPAWHHFIWGQPKRKCWHHDCNCRNAVGTF